MRREGVPASRLTEGMAAPLNAFDKVAQLRRQSADKYFQREGIGASIDLLFGNLHADLGLDSVSCATQIPF